jgi:TolB-like protein
MQSLAVLPFKPLVAAERNEVLELGMAESLISYLARSSRREIRPLSAVRRFAAVDQDAVAAGRALDVDAVLEGLLQRAGDRLRVSVRLLRVDDGSQLWARTFEQPFTEIFAVQDAIVAQIADAIDEPAPRAAALRHDTENPEAFVLFASGSLAFSRLTEPSLHQAIEFFERAVALDSGYARAHAGLADAYMLLAVLGLRTPEDVHANARAAAETALRLDAGLAPAHVSLAQVLLVHDHDLDGARRELDRAVELDASYAPAYFYRGTLAMFRGDAEAALAALDRAMKLDPYRLATRAARGLALLHARRYDESIDSLREVLALDERFDLARGFLMRALLANGEYQEVLVEMRGRKLHGPGSQGFVAQALALSGRQEEARVELAQVLERARREHVPAYDVATIYAALDDVDNAFAWLERAVDDSATVGTIALEPEFEKLHSDPRFETLVARTRTSRAHPSAGKHPL